jgi:hypothetical protein
MLQNAPFNHPYFKKQVFYVLNNSINYLLKYVTDKAKIKPAAAFLLG